jgi:hypothetical protein
MWSIRQPGFPGLNQRGDDHFEVGEITAGLFVNYSLVRFRLFIPVSFWRLFIYGAGIPPQLEAYPDDFAFPAGQIITKDCHCNGQPNVEGFSLSQIGSFIYHQAVTMVFL